MAVGFERAGFEHAALIELDERSWLGANRNWRPRNRSDDPSVELSTVGHILTYV